VKGRRAKVEADVEMLGEAQKKGVRNLFLKYKVEIKSFQNLFFHE
jgi:hypothetical protein